MEQIPNYGDERQLAQCVYCGGDTGTRDHVPPKAFLDEPYPSNLPVVPACSSCNETFSLDEEYVACLVECALTGSATADGVRREKVKRILNSKPALRSRLAQARNETDDGIVFAVEEDRVRTVVLKLGRGHAAFELNEPQQDNPSSVAFVPLVSVSPGVRERFETSPQSTIWPEVGSRAMQRLARPFPAGTDWIIAQPRRYRYLAVASDGVVVRAVLSEYLACEVVWD